MSYVLARFLTLAMFVVAVAWCFRHWHWALDLATHMQAHLLLAAIAVSVFFAATRHWRWAGASLLLIILGCSVVRPWSFWSFQGFSNGAGHAATEAVETRPLRLLVWNTFVHNPDRESVARFFSENDADVVAVLEWTEGLGDALAHLRTSHRYYSEAPAGGAFGIALYSRLPGSIDVVTLPGPVPALRFRPHDVALPIDLWAVHTLPPTGEDKQALRDQQLLVLSQRVRGDSRRMPIIAGDMNITPWADQYRQLLREASLVDSREGFGYAASWPTWLGPLGIPIDHVAVDPRLSVSQRSVRFPSTGSDHAAVQITLEIESRK